MLALLSPLLSVFGGGKTIVYAIAGIALAAVGAWALHYAGENARLTANAAVQAEQLDRLQKVNADNAAALDAFKAEAAKNAAAIAADRDAAIERAAKHRTLYEGIAHAKPKDDGPTAPVLRAALDGLRQHPAGAAPGH